MERYQLFSNGTEFTLWQNRNCCKCVKAVWYNEKKDGCIGAVDDIEHIEEAAVTDGTGSKRDYDATHSYWCPYKCTERKRYPRRKKDSNQTDLFQDTEGDSGV